MVISFVFYTYLCLIFVHKSIRKNNVHSEIQAKIRKHDNFRSLGMGIK